MSNENVSVQPIDRSNNIPIGSIEEAEREGLDVSVYPTCARPQPHRGIRGCDWFDKCVVAAKGKSGPRNYGVEAILGAAQGGGFSKFNTNCMWIADHETMYSKNGGALKVIAAEGEKYETGESVSVDPLTNNPCHQKAPNATRRKIRVEVEVPKYPRPGENPALLTDVLRAESIEAEKERLANEARAKAYGLADAITPIDERSSGAGKGRKTAG